VRQLVDAALGPDAWRSLLPEACAGRLLPTYWLNKVITVHCIDSVHWAVHLPHWHWHIQACHSVAAVGAILPCECSTSTSTIRLITGLSSPKTYIFYLFYLFIYLLLHLPSEEAGVTFGWPSRPVFKPCIMSYITYMQYMQLPRVAASSEFVSSNHPLPHTTHSVKQSHVLGPAYN
jgi:hypothetical protein